MTQLSVKNLSISFANDGRRFEAVKSVSFDINEGEVVALVGESGSGKSVTALSIPGLLPCPPAKVEGEGIIFKGLNLLGLTEAELQGIRGSQISMIFQEPMTALNPLHTIERQIGEMIFVHNSDAFPKRPVGSDGNWSKATAERGGLGGAPPIRGMTKGEVREKVRELLENVGLPYLKERLSSYPHQLSGGERQRVMIAMALANNPKLLIADEPTTALDVTVQAQIIELLKSLRTKYNLSILFISHDLGLVRSFANRAYIMKNGEIVESGTVEEVFTNPKSAYTKKLIESEPKGEALPLDANAKEVMAAKDLKVYFPIKKGVFRKTVGHVKAVDSVSFSLRKGETLGVVGESGSGKSSLGFALLKLVSSTGNIAFEGNEISLGKGLPKELRRQMQMVFQDPFSSLSPRMLVRDIVGEGLLVHREVTDTSTSLRSLVNQALQDVGLPEEMADRYPHELSGGQRQRVSIARAIILKPKLLILDEPTSALDLATQAQILDLLKSLQKERGLSYIFITHDLRVIRAISHKIIVMKKGQVVEEGLTHNLFASPKTDYTKKLIEAAFFER